MENSNLRLRLEDYEFNDEQEFKLTLELINRIEKDIETIKSDKSSDGYSISASIAGFAGALYLLFSEFSKIVKVPFTEIASILLAMLLIGKLSWTISQLVYIDTPPSNSQNSNRFRWANHQLYDQRLNFLYQISIFIISIILLFLINLPIWVVLFTALSFGIYIFLLGMVFVFSYKKQPLSVFYENKLFKIVLPILVIITSIISSIGLLKSVPFPIGVAAAPFVIAGIIFAIIFFLNVAVVLSAPSLLLTNLQQLRRDIIFLKLELKDAWILYEIYMEGNELTEEVRSILGKITHAFSLIEYQQSQQKEILPLIQEEINKLKNVKKLTEEDFQSLNQDKAKFLQHRNIKNDIYDLTSPFHSELGSKINKISGVTKEWEKADNYRQYVLSRLAELGKIDEETDNSEIEMDLKVEKLQAKLKKEVGTAKDN